MLLGQEFQRAWAADHTMTGERLGWPKGGWPYEGGGYWFDGLVRLGYVLPNYALDVPSEKLEADINVDRQAMPATWDWPLESPLKLRTNAVVWDWTPTPTSPLPAEAISSQAPREQITLIPYGCTKFRISMFPVTDRAWKVSETQQHAEQRH